MKSVMSKKAGAHKEHWLAVECPWCCEHNGDLKYKSNLLHTNGCVFVYYRAIFVDSNKFGGCKLILLQQLRG